MKHIKGFNENFITDLFKKSEEDKIADEILKKLETSEVQWVTNISGLERKKPHYLSKMVLGKNTIQVAAYKDSTAFTLNKQRRASGSLTDVFEIYIDNDLLECSDSKSKKIYQVMEKKSSSSNKEQRTNRIKSKIKLEKTTSWHDRM